MKIEIRTPELQQYVQKLCGDNELYDYLEITEKYVIIKSKNSLFPCYIEKNKVNMAELLKLIK